LGLWLPLKSRCAGIRRAASPYSVNSVALVCLAAALGDEEYLRWYTNEVLASRPVFEAVLQRLGVTYWPSRANFVLVNNRSKTSRIRRGHAVPRRLVRDRSADPGCDGCVRITLGTREQTEQGIAALEESLAAIGWTRENP